MVANIRAPLSSETDSDTHCAGARAPRSQHLPPASSLPPCSPVDNQGDVLLPASQEGLPGHFGKLHHRRPLLDDAPDSEVVCKMKNSLATELICSRRSLEHVEDVEFPPSGVLH